MGTELERKTIPFQGGNILDLRGQTTDADAWLLLSAETISEEGDPLEYVVYGAPVFLKDNEFIAKTAKVEKLARTNLGQTARDFKLRYVSREEAISLGICAGMDVLAVPEPK